MHTNISYVDWYVNYHAILHSSFFFIYLIDLIVLSAFAINLMSFANAKFYFFTLALRILVLMGMGGTQSACYLKLR
jgi:hypothetical protein